ncbi:MAG: hypothetical protein SNH27_17115 [Rikenellaceae bacterium]
MTQSLRHSTPAESFSSSNLSGVREFNIDQFEDDVLACKEMNQHNLNKEKLQRIHPDVLVNYNSLNVLCGPQGSGKTFSACKEIAKISQIDKHAHLLVIICKPENQDDPTVNTFIPLINIPIEYVIESDAEDYVKNLFEYKRLYNTIKEQHLEDRIADSQRDELFQTLHINDFSREWLHTMIMINDSAKCGLLKSGSYFSQLVAIGRHTQTSTFLNIQFWKGLSPEIKANISSAFIFGLFSRQQLVHILSQLPSQYDYKEIYEVYRTLSKRDKMIFTNGQIDLEIKS